MTRPPARSIGMLTRWSACGLLGAIVGLTVDSVPCQGAEVDTDTPAVNVVEGGDVIVPDGAEPGGNAGVGGMLMREVRGFFFGNRREAGPALDLDLPEGEDGPMPEDPARAAAWQQRQQIRQQATQMLQWVTPLLNAELELVRNACGDDALPSETRKSVLAAGRKAVKKMAVEFAKAQLNGGMENLDPRKAIREVLVRALKDHASAEATAAYERQVSLRTARRDRAGRSRILWLIDRQLELSPDQYRLIAADLEAKWNAGWPWSADVQGVQINGYRPAPDYAAACITPHLDERQRAAWRAWCTAAGVRAHGLERWGQNFNFGGEVLEADAWWNK
jgi:hypothetical protein